MHYTIFDTPVVSTFMRWLSLRTLKVLGWEVQNTLSAQVKKCVVIAAPHTSNWDMPIMLMVAFSLRLPVYWVGKSSIFRFPFGSLMRWLGGISVDRSKQADTVTQIAQAINGSKKNVYLIISPEGTRKLTEKWKTGFYYIACAAQVPVVCAYMDYEKKRAGIGFTFTPTGDMEGDMHVVYYFYSPIKGKYPNQFNLHKQV